MSNTASETTPREVILSTLRRMSRAGESHEMGARWVMEDLREEGFIVTRLPHASESIMTDNKTAADPRDYKREYNALAHALVGETGLSAITEAGKNATMRAATAALKSFPLPAQGKTSEENYRRILQWLYHREPDVASLIIDLEFGSAENADT